MLPNIGRPWRSSADLPGSRMGWTEFAIVAGAIAIIVTGVVAWERGVRWTVPDSEALSAWLATHRSQWYALPIVALAFAVLGLLMVPVLLMVAATGIAFGPWLGPPYAMAGCLLSASVGFGIGRLAGGQRVERLGGIRARRLAHALKRNGTLAVFFMRKVPAPFVLANILAGASGVRYRDFMLGTLLGMGAFVVALAGFGHQLQAVVRDPTPLMVLAAVACLGIPFGIAWAANRMLRARIGGGPTRAESGS